MLTICIHLYYISVTFTYRIFIAKLQSTSISQIKHMGNYIMLSFLSYMIRCILRCIIHNQYICNLRYFRLFQFFQKRNDCFFLVVCRNNNQDFFFFFFFFFSNVFSVLHRYHSLSSYAISNSFRISPCSEDIRATALFPYCLHFSSSLRSSAIFLLISSDDN